MTTKTEISKTKFLAVEEASKATCIFRPTPDLKKGTLTELRSQERRVYMPTKTSYTVYKVLIFDANEGHRGCAFRGV